MAHQQVGSGVGQVGEGDLNPPLDPLPLHHPPSACGILSNDAELTALVSVDQTE